MDSPLSIKKLTVNDSFPLSQINSLFDEGTEWDGEQGKRFLENPDNIFLLAQWNGHIAGFLTAHRLQRFDKRKAEVLLYEIGVTEDYQNKGIGKALIAEVKAWGIEVGADEVWVVTNKSNIAANSLYKSVGGIIENADETMYTFKVGRE